MQRQVFRHEDGYLGTAPDIAPEQNLANQLQPIAATNYKLVHRIPLALPTFLANV